MRRNVVSVLVRLARDERYRLYTTHSLEPIRHLDIYYRDDLGDH